MPRKTKKYTQALSTIKNKTWVAPKSQAHEDVYELLERHNWFWNAKLGEWEHKQYKPSTSVFEADDGEPTGIGKIRVMGHPDDLPALVNALKKADGFRVIEISEKNYPNRKGSGARIYTTVILEGGAK